jgi:hypothetical protein
MRKIATRTFTEMETPGKIRRFSNDCLGGTIRRTPVTLEETVAGEIAQLLIEAAKARELATQSQQEQFLAKLLNQASELESEGMKWERRLGWWKHLREKPKRPSSKR